MTTIDLIVLGILKKEPLSAYEIQKLVESRNISKWVKISTPSIYKKVLQLEEKGLIKSRVEKEGKMPEKAVYSLTPEGEGEFEKLMVEISAKSVNIYLDFNAVIVNLDSLPGDARQICLSHIEDKVKELKNCLEENLLAKEMAPDIPANGMAVLRQQLILSQALEEWVASLKTR